jgi:hypothetical protein
MDCGFTYAANHPASVAKVRTLGVIEYRSPPLAVANGPETAAV